MQGLGCRVWGQSMHRWAGLCTSLRGRELLRLGAKAPCAGDCEPEFSESQRCGRDSVLEMSRLRALQPSCNRQSLGMPIEDLKALEDVLFIPDLED